MPTLQDGAENRGKAYGAMIDMRGALKPEHMKAMLNLVPNISQEWVMRDGTVGDDQHWSVPE